MAKEPDRPAPPGVVLRDADRPIDLAALLEQVVVMPREVSRDDRDLGKDPSKPTTTTVGSKQQTHWVPRRHCRCRRKK
jgi:hypothetical protein